MSTLLKYGTTELFAASAYSAFACEAAIADSLKLVCSVQIMPSMVDDLDQV